MEETNNKTDMKSSSDDQRKKKCESQEPENEEFLNNKLNINSRRTSLNLCETINLIEKKTPVHNTKEKSKINLFLHHCVYFSQEFLEQKKI